MAEAKKTTKKTKTDKVEVKQAEKMAVEETTAKLKELIENQAIAEAELENKKENNKEVVELTVKNEKKLAKAGKHSARALKEVEEKQTKEERKKATTKTESGETQKSVQKPPRSKAERASKKYREAYKLIELNNMYSLSEAMELATKTSTTKFDSSVEIHIRLGVDPKQADQNIRGNVVLPAGSGKTSRIAVICDADDEKAATSAGADIVGAEKVFAMLDKENFDFDLLVASPAHMSKLGKYAKALGPRGLMPSPKAGTVNADVAKAVSEAKAGKVEYRVDASGIIHLSVGKVSFGGDKLLKNAETVLNAVKAAKPASAKGIYMISVFITTTMGPSIRVVV